jgi:hypothetical protein
VDERNKRRHRSGLPTVQFVTAAFTAIAERVHALFIHEDPLDDRVRSHHLRLAFPNLRHLAMKGLNASSAGGPSELPHFLVRPGGLAFLRLTSLHLSRVMMPWDVMSTLGGLDSVSCQNPVSPWSHDDLIHILRLNAASLRFFRVDVSRSSGIVLRRQVQRLHLPHLKRLEILCTSWRILSGLLSVLDLLAEAELHLSIIDDQHSDPLLGIGNLTGRESAGDQTRLTSPLILVSPVPFPTVLALVFLLA